jgi:hypothetical protein
MAPRLGELLVQRGLCARAAIDEALRAQAVFGARLGTNLLEAGAITEERLALALGDRHEVPALYGDLALDPEALALIAADDADRWEVVPLRAFDRKLALLTVDPGNVTVIDEVAFATGRTIIPFVVPEARLWRLLVRSYRLFREERGEVQLHLPRPVSLAGQGAAPVGQDLIDERDFHELYGRIGFTTPLPFPSPILAAPGIAPVSATSQAPPTVPLAAQAAAPLTADLPPGELPPFDFTGSFALIPELEPEPEEAPEVTAELLPEPSAISFAEAVQALEGVRERGAIARTVLRYARSRFKRALLLTVQRGEIHGWVGMGDGVDVELVHRLRLPVEADGVLPTVAQTRSHYLGPLQKNESNIRLLRALGHGVPGSAFVVPVLALGKVVNLLYADNGGGQQVDPSDLGELLILAARIAQGYDALASRAV